MRSGQLALGKRAKKSKNGGTATRLATCTRNLLCNEGALVGMQCSGVMRLKGQHHPSPEGVYTLPAPTPAKSRENPRGPGNLGRSSGVGAPPRPEVQEGGRSNDN